MKLDSNKLAHKIQTIEEQCFLQPWSLESIVSALQHDNFWIIVTDSGQLKDSFMNTTQECTYYRMEGYAIARYCLSESWIEILRLGISSQSRKKGFARKILSHIESLSFNGARDIKRITIELRKENHVAKNLYLNCGYKVVGKRKAYYAGKGDALIMEKFFIKKKEGDEV